MGLLVVYQAHLGSGTAHFRALAYKTALLRHNNISNVL